MTHDAMYSNARECGPYVPPEMRGMGLTSSGENYLPAADAYIKRLEAALRAKVAEIARMKETR